MLIKLIVMAAMIWASAVLSLAAPLPREIADCKVFKIWEFGTGAEGWVADHNVSQFAVKDGVLSFENIGADPWIINNDLRGPDASSFRFLGIRMRSSVRGSNQIYFATDASPNTAEDKITAYPILGDDKFHFYEVDMSKLSTWSGTITTLRIDPANGASEVGAKIDIDWIALYQVPARITLGRPYVGADEQGQFLQLPIKNIGGDPSGARMVVLVNEERREVESIQPHETRTLTFRLKDVDTAAVSAALEGKTLFRAALCVPTDQGSKARGKEIGNGDTILHIVDDDRAVLYARTHSRLRGAQNSLMAVFRPLATLVYTDTEGVLHYDEIGGDRLQSTADNRIELQSAREINGGTATFKWTFALPQDALEGSVTCELTSTVPIDILRFEGPRLLAGDGSFGAAKTHAVFPGLEYLEENEPSSAEKHIGPKHSDRRVPHPYKVAVPLMAVETADGVVGMSWDPLADWTPGQELPCAQFESPNRSEGAQSHLMALFVPSIPDYVEENAEFAKKPCTLKPGETIRLAASFFARERDTITDVIPNYYQAHGLPKPPPTAHGVSGTIDLCFKAYTDSLYFPDQRVWRNHIGLRQKPAFNPGYAALILGESLRKNDRNIARKCGIGPDAQISDYVGTTLDWFSDNVRNGVDAAVAGQSPDGGFPYEISEEQIEKVKQYAEMTGTDADTLGDIGETNSGLIVRELNGILVHALRTGRRNHIDAGLKGLAKLNTFTVPRGAQTWEVHAHAPDIFAAGLAVDANIAGYQLTGDEKYLAHARFWAYTGLPFVYSWIPPIDPVPSAVLVADEKGEGKNLVFARPSEFYEQTRRCVNPGATIPVLGTSFYIVSWFGTPVQWCGLVWANSVRQYVRLRPDSVLESVADMVFASGTQQQTERGFLAGTYPDAWNLITNTANTAFIAPDTILAYAYDLKGEHKPGTVDSLGFDLRGQRAYLNTYAMVLEWTSHGDALDAILKFYANQDLYTSIVPAPKPVKVTVDGKPLPESADIKAAQAGYFYDRANKALHIKYRVPARKAALSVQW